MPLTVDEIWQRALAGNSPVRLPGDAALALILDAHELASAQGPAAAARTLGQDDFRDLLAAYELLGLDDVGLLFMRAARDQPGSEEAAKNAAEYARAVPDHERIRGAFRGHFQRNPQAYDRAERGAPRTRAGDGRRALAGTMAATLVALAFVGSASAAAWSWYARSAKQRALSALRETLSVQHSEARTAFEQRHGMAPWSEWHGVPKPVEKLAVSARAWLAVEALSHEQPRGWPGKGLVVGIEDKRVQLHSAQLELAPSLRANTLAEAGWLAFVHRERFHDAYRFGIVWVDVEHADVEIVDAVTGAPLAYGSAESIPPPSQTSGEAQELYELDDATLAQLVEKALAAVGSGKSEAPAKRAPSPQPLSPEG